jgi:mRNA interferase MazF
MPGYEPGDVVIVPFPFTDRYTSKRRPALVCSATTFNRATKHLVLAMITTARRSEWPGDCVISDLEGAGLPAPSVVRWKLFTLEESFVLRRAGMLSTRDRSSARAAQPIAV